MYKSEKLGHVLDAVYLLWQSVKTLRVLYIFQMQKRKENHNFSLISKEMIWKIELWVGWIPN